MSIRHSLLFPIACVVVLSGYGCDDNGDTEPRADRLGPSPISFNGLAESATNSVDFYGHGVTLQPAIVIPQIAPAAACPTRPPFLAPIRLIVSDEAGSDLFLNKVQIEFADVRGVLGESMTLTGSRLIDLFGSTRIPRFGRRAFPFTFPFGCIGERTGRLSVSVFTGDAAGRNRRSSSSIVIR